MDSRILVFKEQFFMQKLLILFLFLVLSVCFSGCNSYILQDIIGNPTKHLDTYSKNFVVLLEYKPEYVYNKLKAYLNTNQCNIYKTQKISKNSKIYARNLVKIFKNVNITTDILFDISLDEKANMAEIKIVSLNYELAEYFGDVLKDILQNAERKDKELEAKRLEDLKKEEIAKNKKNINPEGATQKI
jgi:hypothetical protein